MASSDSWFPPTPECDSMQLALYTFSGLMWVTIILRFVARRRRQVALGWDDGLVFFAALGATASAIIFGYFIRLGLGYHVFDPRWSQTFVLESKLYLCYEILYTMNSSTAKISALLFYIRVIPTSAMKRASYISIACIAIPGITFLLISFLGCRPLSANWNYQLKKNGHCMDRNPTFIASCVVNILTDFLVLALPLRPIWTLKMEKKTKIGLMCVFASGIVVTIFSLIRLYFVANIDYDYDFSYTSPKAIFFTALEPALMVICISLPMLYTLFPKRPQKSDNFQNKSRSLSAIHTLARRRHKQNFTALEETQLTTYDMEHLPDETLNRDYIEIPNETITVQETFSVQDEPACSGDTIGRPDPALLNAYYATAWSEGTHQDRSDQFGTYPYRREPI